MNFKLSSQNILFWFGDKTDFWKFRTTPTLNLKTRGALIRLWFVSNEIIRQMFHPFHQFPVYRKGFLMLDDNAIRNSLRHLRKSSRTNNMRRATDFSGKVCKNQKRTWLDCRIIIKFRFNIILFSFFSCLSWLRQFLGNKTSYPLGNSNFVTLLICK